ncbi:MAG: hypothetical protein FWC00_03190 [Firmicutes bacterium]|nr:hypothetical protein [Bacillota bacterium]
MAAVNSIINKAELEIEGCEDAFVVESNQTEVDIVDITLTKTSGCHFAVVGGTISYCVKIENHSGEIVPDALFKDVLSSRVSYVTGSFTVDGTHETPTISGNTISYEIPELHPSPSSTMICFKVKVLH